MAQELAAVIDATMSSEMESIKKKQLFTFAMKGQWERVIEMYEEDPRAHKSRITRSGDTALHIAVSEGKDEVVAEMVRSIMTNQDQPHIKEALQTQNNRRNTALHLAAEMGHSTICEKIATVEPSLLACRNGDGETPLFSAARFGRKPSFLFLHYIQNRNLPDGYTPPYYVNCRRNDGDTILHCAISGDYFDLAFQIIHLYEDLVTSVNNDGLSPLHLLAAKPSSFRSGSRLGRLEGIIYHCLYVEKLKEAEPRQFHTDKHKDDQAKCPPNYRVLWDIVKVIKSAVTTAVGKGQSQANTPKDIEKAKNNYTTASAGGSEVKDHGIGLFPENYRTCFNFVKYFDLGLLKILGLGSSRLSNIRGKKTKNTWSVQIMNELLVRASDYEYEDSGSRPDYCPIPEELSSLGLKLSTAKDRGAEDGKERKKETPILIAAKNGVTEMIKEILKLFPVAIYDENEEKKNIVLLAVEKRQPNVYLLLMENNFFKESLFQQVDNEGNSALHLAAKRGPHEPWRISGAALQMQWDIKWYKFVENSLPPHFFAHYNKSYKTPIEIFNETHSDLVQSGEEWLNKTSESCSVVAALVAGVSFATSSTVPGGNDDNTGKPTLEGQPGFDIFAISALLALCFSVTALILFLSILTSGKKPFDFLKKLPVKLFLALSSLFVSIFSMFISFCAAHSFVLEDKFKKSVLPLYAFTCLPVFFTIVEFPLYMDLFRGIFPKVPRTYN
ncbi:hypothetical protein QN277_012723 [Acacia crassicarpa]|uniref:PGG domain-containing protein n=1 Tax=Acacia crassicarpa TaxID=499986 RepID=A0AAE1N1V8_9FABA|nr:hypothetical protein QN277_012723 [Acacia crassicarpa]